MSACPRCHDATVEHWPDDERMKPGCHARGCLCSYTPEDIARIDPANPAQDAATARTDPAAGDTNPDDAAELSGDEGYGEHTAVLLPGAVHAYCDLCDQRWPCSTVRAYDDGRAQLAAVTAERDALRAQLDRLADWILDHAPADIDGSQDDASAVAVAIRIMRDRDRLRAERDALRHRAKLLAATCADQQRQLGGYTNGDVNFVWLDLDEETDSD